MTAISPVPLLLKESQTTMTPITAASQLAVERFNAVMQSTTPASISHTNGVSPALVPEITTPATPGPSSIGTRILGTLQQSSNDLTGRWQAMAERLDHASAKPNVAELLHVQAQLLQVSVHYELVSKAISKSTQNVDTMVRMQ